jgi:hypothetical protein
LALDKSYFKGLDKVIKLKVVKIISNDVDLLLMCIRKYLKMVLNNEDILLSSSKDKKDKINEIKNLLITKEASFVREISGVRSLLDVFIK